MEATASMHASIDEKLRDQAISVLAEMGLTVSGIVRMSLTRIARDEALPSALESRRGPHPRYFRIRPAREGGRRGSGDHKHNVPEVYRAEQGGRAAGAPPVYRGIDRWRTSRHLHRPSTQRPSMLWPVPNTGPAQLLRRCAERQRTISADASRIRPGRNPNAGPHTRHLLRVGPAKSTQLSTESAGAEHTDSSVWFYSNVETKIVAPPVAKFGTSSAIFFHSGRPVTAFIAAAFLNQISVSR